MQTQLLRRTRPNARQPRRGAVLILALIAVVTVSTMAAGFLQLAAMRTKSQVGAVDRKEAFYLAEAGLAEAYVGLRVGRTGNVGTETSPAGFGGGLFWVDAEDLGNEQIALHSTGMAGRARVSLDIVVERSGSGPRPMGLYTAGALALAPGTTVDSYDSTQGTYGEQEGSDAMLEGVSSVGSGSDLSLSGTRDKPVVIRGDVSYGSGASYIKGGDVYVSGTEGAAATPRPLNPVQLPSLIKYPALTHSSAIPIVVGPGEHAFDGLLLEENAEALLQGPLVLLAGDLVLEEGARLIADTAAGPVDIYVDDNLSLGLGSTVENLTDDPQLLTIQYAGSTAATLSVQGEFYGVLSAPTAEIVLSKSSARLSPRS